MKTEEVIHSQKQKFPCLFKASNGAILLATEKRSNGFIEGVIIKGGRDSLVGTFSSDWGAAFFTPLPSGTQIILTQE